MKNYYQKIAYVGKGIFRGLGWVVRGLESLVPRPTPEQLKEIENAPNENTRLDLIKRYYNIYERPPTG